MATKKSIRILTYAFASIFVMGLISLLFFWRPFYPPEKPLSVPSTAKWDGGPDGGNWIDCVALKDSTNRFFCTVYEDQKGKVLYKGAFKLAGKQTSISDLRNLLGVYSGDHIYLKDGRQMITVVPLDSSTYEDMMKREPPRSR